MVILSRFACTPLPLNLQTFCGRILFFGDTLISYLSVRWWTRGLANMSCSSLQFESQLEKVCYHIVCAKTGCCGKKIHTLFPTSGKTPEEGNQNLQRFSLRSICRYAYGSVSKKTCVWLWSGSGWVVMFTPIWRRFAVWTRCFWSVSVNQDPLEIYKTLSIRWSVIAYCHWICKFPTMYFDHTL